MSCDPESGQFQVSPAIKPIYPHRPKQYTDVHKLNPSLTIGPKPKAPSTFCQKHRGERNFCFFD